LSAKKCKSGLCLTLQPTQILAAHSYWRNIIIKPGIVLRQPTTSITDAGQNTYIQSVPVAFGCRTPATPNQSSVRTAPEIAKSNNAPMSNTVRFVKENLPVKVGTPNCISALGWR